MSSSIYDVVGGDGGFLRLTTALHARCLADPQLNHPFTHADANPEHVPRLSAYLAEVFGGPPRFTTDYGNHSDMLGLHAHMGMESDLGSRFVACFVAAAGDAGLPADPALRDALRDYMQWAVDDVMLYDPPESVVPQGLGVPRWSWDGLQPASA